MSFDAGSVIAKMKADLTDFQAGLNKAKDSMAKFVDSTKAGVDSMNAKIKTIEPQLKSISVTFGVIGAVGVAAIKSWIDASIDADTKMAKFNATMAQLGDAGAKAKGALIAAGDATTKLGFDNEEATVVMGNFYARTRDVSQAIQLNNVAMDLSRAKTIGLSAAANLVNQALSGNGKVLKAYGINIKDTATPLEALAQLQKVVAGQAQAFAETFAGKVATLTMRIQNLQEALGSGLQPVFEVFLDIGNAVMAWVESLSPATIGLIAIVTALGTAFALAVAATAAWTLFLPTLTAMLGVLATAMGVVTGFLLAWAAPVAAVIAIVAILYEAWVHNFMGIQQITADALMEIKGLWSDLMAFLGPVFNAIAQAAGMVPKIIADDWNLYLNAVTISIEAFVKTVISVIDLINKLPVPKIDTSGLQAFNKQVESVRVSASLTAQDVSKVFSSVAGAVKSGASSVVAGVTMIGKGFTDFKDGFVDGQAQMGGASKKTAEQQAKDTQAELANRQKVIAAFGDFKDKIQSLLTDLRDTHKDTMASMGKDIADVQKKLKTLAQGYQTDLENIKKDLAKNIADMDTTLQKTILTIKVKFETDKAGITTDTNQSVAEKYVTEQNDVADLKKQIAAATTSDEKKQLEQQLADKQKILDTDAQYVIGLDAQIAEVKRVNGLTEIQQIVEQGAAKIAAAAAQRDADILAATEEYNAKKVLALQDATDKEAARLADYTSAKITLQQELGDKQKAMADEVTLFDAKEKAIIDLRNKSVAIYAQQLQDQVTATDRAVNAMITRYQALNTAIQQVGKVKNLGNLTGMTNIDLNNIGKVSNLPDLTNPITNFKLESIPKAAAGGTVRASSGGTLVLVGEGEHDERITPLDGKSGGGDIHIHLDGAKIWDKQSAVEILDLAMRSIAPRLGV